MEAVAPEAATQLGSDQDRRSDGRQARAGHAPSSLVAGQRLRARRSTRRSSSTRTKPSLKDVIDAHRPGASALARRRRRHVGWIGDTGVRRQPRPATASRAASSSCRPTPTRPSSFFTSAQRPSSRSAAAARASRSATRTTTATTITIVDLGDLGRGSPAGRRACPTRRRPAERPHRARLGRHRRPRRHRLRPGVRQARPRHRRRRRRSPTTTATRPLVDRVGSRHGVTFVDIAAIRDARRRPSQGRRRRRSSSQYETRRQAVPRPRSTRSSRPARSVAT